MILSMLFVDLLVCTEAISAETSQSNDQVLPQLNYSPDGINGLLKNKQSLVEKTKQFTLI